MSTMIKNKTKNKTKQNTKQKNQKHIQLHTLHNTYTPSPTPHQYFSLVVTVNVTHILVEGFNKSVNSKHFTYFSS